MLNHVTLEVSRDRLRVCVDFYRGLGLYEVAVPDDMGVEGAILAHESGLAISLMARDEPVVMPAGHVALVADDYEGALRRLEAAGVAVDRRPPYWGAGRAFFHDPQGNRLELLEWPPEYEPRRDDGRASAIVWGGSGGRSPSQ